MQGLYLRWSQRVVWSDRPKISPDSHPEMQENQDQNWKPMANFSETHFGFDNSVF